MTTLAKIAEIDRRAFAAGMSLSQLASKANVSSATMAKMRAEPTSVRVRAFSKLEAALDAIEREKSR